MKQYVAREEDMSINFMMVDDVILMCEKILKSDKKNPYFRYNHYGHDGGYDLTLVWEEIETDSEFHERVRKEEVISERKAKTAAKKEAGEKKMYEQLKVKYG